MPSPMCLNRPLITILDFVSENQGKDYHENMCSRIHYYLEKELNTLSRKLWWIDSSQYWSQLQMWSKRPESICNIYRNETLNECRHETKWKSSGLMEKIIHCRDASIRQGGGDSSNLSCSSLYGFPSSSLCWIHLHKRAILPRDARCHLSILCLTAFS